MATISASAFNLLPKATIGVYVISNIVNGKKYVGQSRDIRRRIKQHFINATKSSDKCSALYSSIRKYGASVFEFEILAECSIEELNTLEAHFVDNLNTISPNGYNLRRGGNEKLMVLESTKLKISKKNKGRVVSIAAKEKFRETMGLLYPNGREAWNKGQKTTGRALDILLKRNISRKGLPAWNKGIATPDTVKVKLSIAHTGKKLKDSTKDKLRKCMLGRDITWGDKISKTLKGRDLGDEWRNKLTLYEQKGIVIMCSNGKVYLSLKEASIDTGAAPSNILKVCAGKRKTTAGLTFYRDITWQP